MHRWRVGQVEVVRIEDDDFTLPSERPVPDWAVPAFTPSVDQFPAAFSAIALTDGAHHVVVDPWLANDGARTRPDDPGTDRHPRVPSGRPLGRHPSFATPRVRCSRR